MTWLFRRAARLVCSLTIAAAPAWAWPGLPQALPDTTDDHIEANLRPILPPFIVDELRSVRHPNGSALAADLAARAGIHVARREGLASTGSFVDDITSSQRHVPDLSAYLRVRLFDLLVGDWSRRPTDLQWELDSASRRWTPIAAPYRNPFTRFRGFVPNIVLLASETMTDFTEAYPPAERPSDRMLHLDRRLLGGLSPSRWDSVTLDFQQRLAEALAGWPAEGDAEIVQVMVRRVETLPAASEDLRRVVDRWIALHGTDGDDSMFVRVRQGHLVSLSIGPRGSTSRSDELAFNSAGTQDVRLVTGAGNDVVAFEGPVPRLSFEIVSQGRVSVLSRSSATTPWRSTVPLGVQQHYVETRPAIDRQDWGRTTDFRPWLDLDSDDWLFVGGGPVTTTYGFGLSPFAQQTTAMVGMASATFAVRALIGYETREWWRNVGVRAGLRFAQADMTKFFGIGNETPGASTEAEVRKYEGRRRDLEMSGGISMPLGSSWSFDVTARVTSSAIRAERGSVVDSLLSTGAVRSMNYATAGASIAYDTRGDALVPADAVVLSGSLEMTPAFLQNRMPYLRGVLDGQVHVALADTAAVIVARVSGEALSGTPPWFESAAIGGSHSLRGYERERFRGDASVVTGLEARIPFWTIPFIWPHETGIILFAESGRVFVGGETSRRWHSSVGAGGWVRPVRASHLLSATIARSAEDWKLSATLGFAF